MGLTLLRRIVPWLPHILTILIIAYGTRLRLKFQNGDECEMTYSWRQFIPCSAPQSTFNYKLYKFVDARDPRHRSLLGTIDAPVDTHCNNNHSKAVIYIPGHWGSFTQCRSLGAHGVQLTRQRETSAHQYLVLDALSRGLWHDSSQDVDSFVYDVYCLDFAEQGSAFHGAYLRSQAEFVAKTVLRLAADCDLSHLTLVGHSIGGAVARSVPMLHPSVKPFINAVITLATPWPASPFLWEESVAEFYKQLRVKKSPDFILFSICGGLRDELIPPGLCASSAAGGIAAEASSIMAPRQAGPFPQYGMDHRAITWCHNLLSIVRIAIHEIWRRDGIREQEDALISLVERRAGITAKERRLRPSAIESLLLDVSMVYNVELVSVLFAVIGVGNLALMQDNNERRLSSTSWVLIFLVSALAWWCSGHNALHVVLLTLCADFLFCGIRCALSICPPLPWSNRSAVCVFVGFGILFGALLCRESSNASALVPTLFLATTSSSVVMAVSLASTSRGNLIVATIYVGILPLLAFGKASAVISTIKHASPYVGGLFEFVCVFVLPALSRLLIGTVCSATSWLNSLGWMGLYSAITVASSTDMMSYGGGYRLTSYCSAIICLDIVRQLANRPK